MTSTAFATELARHGPAIGAEQSPPTLEESFAYCRRLAHEHYENFVVVSRLLPRPLRQHFANVYAYCRWADDLADEASSPQQSLDLLDWWELQLDDCYAGRATHPVFVALRETIEEFSMPSEPLRDLLSAFRQDQRVTRYQRFADLLDYCRRSANPVGRVVLYLGRVHDAQRGALADCICTGLQLANFWQDVAADWRRGRLYIPLEDCRQFGVEEGELCADRVSPSLKRLLAFEVDRAEGWLRAGLPLVEELPRWLSGDIWLVAQGGLKILQKIDAADYDVWTRRPVVSRWDRAVLVGGYLLRRLTARV